MTRLDVRRESPVAGPLDPRAQRGIVLVGLTGTPGVGKTSTGRALRRLGFPVVSLNRLAHRFAVGYDRKRRSRVVDERRLARWVLGNTSALHARASRRVPRARRWSGVLVVEGHLAHELPFLDLLVLLRLDPRLLEARLRRKGYSRAKARENAEAEAVGIIANECRGRPHSVEVDVTRLTPSQAARKVAGLLADPSLGRPIGSVDWSEAILAWH